MYYPSPWFTSTVERTGITTPLFSCSEKLPRQFSIIGIRSSYLSNLRTSSAEIEVAIVNSKSPTQTSDNHWWLTVIPEPVVWNASGFMFLGFKNGMKQLGNSGIKNGFKSFKICFQSLFAMVMIMVGTLSCQHSWFWTSEILKGLSFERNFS